jgi:hypothetical protein
LTECQYAGTLPAIIIAGSVPDNIMAKKIKYISILSIIGVVFVAGVALFFSNKITASAGDNIRGWIWAENVGWISFNSVNCDSDSNNITDTGNYPQCPTGTASVDYGVSVLQPTGNFSGYGWSENIGWINFAPAGPYPSAPNYSTCLDWPSSISTSEPCNGFGNYNVSGWARAVSPVGQPANATGGWDGWIKLAGNSGSYGVSLNSVTGRFSGWAWGGDDSSEEAVIGWNKVNGAGYGGSDNCGLCIPPISYPVTVTGLLADHMDYCNSSGGSMSYPPFTLHWTFDGGGMNTQDKYQIQVINNSTGAIVVDSCPSGAGTCTSGHSGTDFSITPLNGYGSLSFNATYNWKIKVWGSSGSVSGWINGANFTTAIHRFPNPAFTADPTTVLPDRPVTFTNNSTCYDSAGNAIACINPSGNPYFWDFGDGVMTSVATNASQTHPYATKGSYVVHLNATDGLGSCSVGADMKVRPPLPSWEEVPPTF